MRYASSKLRIVFLFLALLCVILVVPRQTRVLSATSHSVIATIKAKVRIDGEELGNRQFTFNLMKDGQVVDTQLSDSEGNITFKPLVFNNAGKYEYKVVQHVPQGDSEKIQYDLNERAITVQITEQDLRNVEVSKKYYGTSVSKEHITMGEVSGGKDFQVFCINEQKTLPPNTPNKRTYSVLKNPSTAELEKVVTHNLYGDKLGENLKKIFFYFQAFPDKYSVDKQKQIVWAATGAYGSTLDSVGQYDTDLDTIFKTELPSDYNLVLFNPDETEEEKGIYQSLSMGYGAAISHRKGLEAEVSTELPMFVNKIKETSVSYRTALAATNEIYEAYNDTNKYGDSTLDGSWGINLYVRPWNTASRGDVALCFNDHKSPPEELGDHQHVKYTKNDNPLEWYKKANKPRLQGKEFADAISKIIYYGYPMNGLKIGTKDNEEDFHRATQYALWYYTDSESWEQIGATRGSSDSVKKIFDQLIQSDASQVPKDLKLSLYVAGNSNNGTDYQHIIGISTDSPTHNLTISKKVTGNGRDENKQFSFEIELKDAKQQPLEGTYKMGDKDLTLVNGKANLSLKHGDSVTISDLPSGYSYKVTESSADGYEVLVDGKPSTNRSSAQSNVTSDKTMAFENRKKEKTGAKIFIRKYAEGDYASLLSGATLNLKQTSGTGFEGATFISDSLGKEFTLPEGTYELTETKAPEGYDLADKITFKVENGKVYIQQKDGRFIENKTKEVAKPYSVTAYNDFNDDSSVNDDHDTYGKNYYAKNRDGSSQIVYCFNVDRKSPPDSYDDGANIDSDVNEGKEIKYTHISGQDLYKYAAKPRDKDPQLFLKHIKKVIERGLRDKNQSIEYGGLSATQLRAATQLAIYYFTDSADLDNLKGYHGFDALDSKTLTVAKILIDYAKGDAEPTIGDLDFFVPNSNKYQSLIGTSYHPDDLVDIIRMEDKKTVVPTTHQLTLSKTVTGSTADKNKAFTFDLTLADSNGSPLQGNYKTTKEDLVVNNGKASVTLKDGESLTISGLPDGYAYQITERDADGYEVKINNQAKSDRSISEKNVTSDKIVAFENHKEGVVPTGIADSIITYLTLAGITFVGLLLMLKSRLKKDR
ncbi:pilus ancillary protein 1 [Streptococcus castoreus]|uniref:pilus ancillary protein 1 n=1 Tax=Streptococcus castoreus TaxID=254786 RepID=UPI0006860FA9|nr:pilus ancillary protein 1 [Streptococcus castoreus]